MVLGFWYPMGRVITNLTDTKIWLCIYLSLSSFFVPPCHPTPLSYPHYSLKTQICFNLNFLEFQINIITQDGFLPYFPQCNLEIHTYCYINNTLHGWGIFHCIKQHIMPEQQPVYPFSVDRHLDCFSLGSLQIKLVRTFIYKFFNEHLSSSFFLGKCLADKEETHKVYYLTF